MATTTMSDVEQLAVCCTDANALVRSTLGFADDDFAQDACEAMIHAAADYEPGRGATFRTWLVTRARWAIVDAYRVRDGRVRDGVKHHEPPASIDNFDTLGVDDDELDLVDDLIDDRARIGRLRIGSALSAFTPRAQAIIRHRLDGERGTDIAHELHVDESEVTRTFAKFRALLIARNPTKQEPR